MDKFVFNKSIPEEINLGHEGRFISEWIEVEKPTPILLKYVTPEQFDRYCPDWFLPMVEKIAYHICDDLYSLTNEDVITFRKNVYVDFKVVEVEAGKGVCPVTTWHTDLSLDPFDGYREDLHYIFFTGCDGTRFMTRPMEVTKESDIPRLLEHSPTLPSIQMKSGKLIRYWFNNVHQGPIATRDYTRLFFKISFTDRERKGSINGKQL